MQLYCKGQLLSVLDRGENNKPNQNKPKKKKADRHITQLLRHLCLRSMTISWVFELKSGPWMLSSTVIITSVSSAFSHTDREPTLAARKSACLLPPSMFPSSRKQWPCLQQRTLWENEGDSRKREKKKKGGRHKVGNKAGRKCRPARLREETPRQMYCMLVFT